LGCLTGAAGFIRNIKSKHKRKRSQNQNQNARSMRTKWYGSTKEKRQKHSEISSRDAQCGNDRQPLHVQFENNTLSLYPSRSKFKLIVENQKDHRK